MSRVQMLETMRNYRRWLLIMFDCVAWGVAVVLASLARMDFDADYVNWPGALRIWLLAVLFHTAIAWAVRLHHGRATVATLEEMLWLGSVVLCAGVAVFLIDLVTHIAPRSVPLTALVAALAIMAWARATWRRLTSTIGAASAAMAGSLSS